MDINADTHVLTLTTAGSTTLTIKLTDSQLAQLEDTNSKHYINYLSDLEATTDADIALLILLPTLDCSTAIPVNNGDQITLTDDADGTFTVTFTTDMLCHRCCRVANTAIQNAVRHATRAAAADDADCYFCSVSDHGAGINNLPAEFTRLLSPSFDEDNAYCDADCSCSG